MFNRAKNANIANKLANQTINKVNGHDLTARDNARGGPRFASDPTRNFTLDQFMGDALITEGVPGKDNSAPIPECHYLPDFFGSQTPTIFNLPSTLNARRFVAG